MQTKYSCRLADISAPIGSARMAHDACGPKLIRWLERNLLPPVGAL